jgi:Ca2+-binding EF-hand superfamily protein
MKKFLITAASAALITGSAFFAIAEESKTAANEGKPMHKGGMLGEMDANGDGAVSKDEFVAHAGKMFTEMDANKDGKVTEEEMKAHQVAQKAKHEAMQKEMQAKQEAHFKEMDTNNDGQISKEEMMNFKGKPEGDKKN